MKAKVKTKILTKLDVLSTIFLKHNFEKNERKSNKNNLDQTCCF